MARINFVTYERPVDDGPVVTAAREKAPAKAKEPAKRAAVKTPAKKAARKPTAVKAKALAMEEHVAALKRHHGRDDKRFYSVLGRLHDDKGHNRRDIQKMLKEHFGITKIGHIDREHSLNVLAERHVAIKREKAKAAKAPAKKPAAKRETSKKPATKKAASKKAAKGSDHHPDHDKHMRQLNIAMRHIRTLKPGRDHSHIIQPIVDKIAADKTIKAHHIQAMANAIEGAGHHGKVSRVKSLGALKAAGLTAAYNRDANATAKRATPR